MAAKDNSVFSVILQFCGSFRRISPEAVLYGYAKLLLMGEVTIKNLLNNTEMTDLNMARKVIEAHNLDLELIKNGTMILSKDVWITSEDEEKYQKFERFLAGCTAGTSSADILEKVFEYACIPLEKVYGNGSTMEDIFDYQTKLKNRSREEEIPIKPVPERDGNSKQPESAPQESDEAEEKEEDLLAEDILEEWWSDLGEEIEKDKKSGNLYEMSEKYRKLSTALYDVVKGQDAAVAKFVQGCYQGELLKSVEKRKQPQSYFFFFGPPGVGKTLLAETAAETLGRPYKIYNMSEYVAPNALDELVGTSKSYSNSREGSLVKFVRENPECILVFDEIEKAHITVIRLFLQILGSGRMNNISNETTTSFEESIIIFTSNVGKELYTDRSVNLTTLPEGVIINAIQQEKTSTGAQVLPNEICSRIASGNTIMFNHLSIRHLAEMTKGKFDKVAGAMSELYGCQVSYTNKLPLLFLYNRGSEIDARVATNQSSNFLKREIYELSRQLENYKAADKNINSIYFDVEWDDVDKELMKLFVNDVKTEVLVLADEEVQRNFKVNEDKIKVHFAKNIKEAREILKNDITAVFIDPFFGKLADSSTILSITDYNTEGIQFFYELAEAQTNINIYLMEVNKEFSEIDRKTFIQIGAADTLVFNFEQSENFARMVEEILDEVYMEQVSCTFSQQGWVIDFKSKQDVTEDGRIKVLFYDLKKRQAVDAESRSSLLSDANRPDVKFNDVIGAEKAKEELAYFIEYLKNPKRFLVMGGKPPKGVLLYGPPGTGKTMLAKAMAGESDVTFIQTSASEFKNKYVGESEANIRKVFARARKYAPAIIFIDEIDAIGKQRTGSETTANEESMLNALLTEMDGFVSDNKKPIFVLAATNFGVSAGGNGIAALDSALMRRFDNKIYVDLPNESERKRYIEVMLSKKKDHNISEDVVKNIAERTTGQSLAILQNVFDLAYRNATKEHRVMDGNDLLNALEEFIYGEKREKTPEHYRSVAIHEVGHGYISYISGDKPSYITIESRGDFGGYMQHGNSEGKGTYTKEELLAKIRTSLAGRAAESVFLGKEKANNTGASSDLEHATHYAFLILTTYGMEEGQLIILSKEEILKSSLAGEYIKQVNALLVREMEKTVALIKEGKDTIQRIVDVLVSKNHLTGAEFAELMETK